MFVKNIWSFAYYEIEAADEKDYQADHQEEK
jgi:hypothetical protein